MSYQCCLGYGPAYPDCKRKYMFLSNNLLIIAINIKLCVMTLPVVLIWSALCKTHVFVLQGGLDRIV